MADVAYKTVPFGYRRLFNAPLEADSLFATFEEAQAYAATNPTAYAGRQIAVVTAETSDLYIIKPDMSLAPIGGSSTEGKTPFIAEYKFTAANASDTGLVIATIPAGYFIEDMIVVLTEAFADGITISVGTDSDPNAYYPAEFIYPQEAEVPINYEMDISTSCTTTTAIYLYITGVSATGAGMVKVTVG